MGRAGEQGSEAAGHIVSTETEQLQHFSCLFNLRPYPIAQWVVPPQLHPSGNTLIDTPKDTIEPKSDQNEDSLTVTNEVFTAQRKRFST